MMLSRFPMGGGGAGIKFASGSASANQSLTISGLAFRPIAVGIYNDPSAQGIMSWGLADEEGNMLAGRWGSGWNYGGSSLFSATDDGFTIKWGSYSGNLTVNWYAIGY